MNTPEDFRYAARKPAAPARDGSGKAPLTGRNRLAEEIRVATDELTALKERMRLALHDQSVPIEEFRQISSGIIQKLEDIRLMYQMLYVMGRK